ncbi:hypothetical protein [Burkholderia thailandensis]|uniref:hypothetical protein n=1 Tax=Burkholderia thailandensis TaxID=57975 RepID=UPI002164F50C|nr:hypothetical protein [Burkholderia thailandensis]MCS3390364.1 hypothetical protein [Burkholderia thailandensis]
METPPSATDKAIAACSFSTHYARMYEEMGNRPTLPTFSVTEPVLSKALFFHLAQLRYAGWKYAVTVRRDRRHALADVFQDLVAYYLRAALAPHACLVELEASMPGANGGDKTQVDIVILKKRGPAEPVPFFAIEVKTTIGRGRIRTEEEKKPHLARLEQVASNFRLPDPSNVIFIHEEPSNNTGDFERLYWAKNSKDPTVPFPGQRKLPRPTDPLYSRIYPLFFGTDPKMWDWSKEKDNRTKKYQKHKTSFPDITRERFIQEAEQRIVTPLEEVIDLILNASRAVED